MNRKKATADGEAEGRAAENTAESGGAPAPAENPDAAFKRRIFRKIKRAAIPKEGEFEHFDPAPDKGLTDEQVRTRFSQYLVNDSHKKYSRSYLSIVTGNLLTFFNLLAALVAAALI